MGKDEEADCRLEGLTEEYSDFLSRLVLWEKIESENLGQIN